MLRENYYTKVFIRKLKKLKSYWKNYKDKNSCWKILGHKSY
jgi:hypothetical protein